MLTQSPSLPLLLLATEMAAEHRSMTSRGDNLRNDNAVRTDLRGPISGILAYDSEMLLRLQY